MAFKELTEALLSFRALRSGVQVAFGTHDHRMVEHAQRSARALDWPVDRWEIEMLLGVRDDYQRRLVEEGVPVRVYLPFGRRWWPYCIRWVGEHPRNLGFALRGMLG